MVDKKSETGALLFAKSGKRAIQGIAKPIHDDADRN